MGHILGYLCSSTSWGGLEMNQLKNAGWMLERGHKVFLLCKKDSPIEKAAKEASIPILTIEKHKKYYDFSAGKKLASIIDSNQISHLIVRDTRDMSVAVIAKRKAKSILHLSYFMEMQLGVKKTNLLHTIRFSYFDVWSCPLNWLKQQVLTMTKMKPSKVHVIPSGLDLKQFELEVTKSDARKELNLPENVIIIGLIGRFDPHKGQVLLLEAMKLAKDKQFICCFLGEPTKEAGSEYVDLMHKTIEDNQLKERVFISPFRKDIATFFKAIDAFVMASKAETFGMVTIEAMACGVPVIASNAGGSPEILDFGKFGMLFEPLNPESLARKIDLFCEEPNAFSPQALQKEAVKYTHDGVCSEVEKLLKLKK
jgi:glycosyltransferase involved in cell wall biosynthesis